jgi:hypothetical protein
MIELRLVTCPQLVERENEPLSTSIVRRSTYGQSMP